MRYLLIIVRIWSRIYTYSRSTWLSNWKAMLYTMWISYFIGRIGQNCLICPPCKLWGGGSKRIVIGDNTVIQSHCILGCWLKYAGDTFTPKIKIGSNCNIGEYTHISAINNIKIGNGVLTGRYVYIGDNSHGGFSREEMLIQPIKRRLVSKGEIIIGDNVWIGDKATILAGISIGQGAIIGANAVVTRDVPPFSIVGGNPARIIKQIGKICQNQD